VSGSGKSSLVVETLVPLLREALRRRELSARSGRGPAPLVAETIELDELGRLRGAAPVTRLVEVDQSPLGRSSRATPATLSGIWNEIRRLLARTRSARQLGFGAARFSFQSPAGRCAACRGLGCRKVAAELLLDAQAPCPICRGDRFNPQTLQVTFRDHNAAQLLALRVDEALPLFQNIEKIRRMLQTLVDVGLGYLALGQSSSTLSGGESQRVKLAMELGRETPGHTLYVLDEPTTGLHPADIERLLALLQRLVDAGHSVLVIEHQLDVIWASDWVIDLGPEGGAGGGQIVAAGTPLDLIRNRTGHTAAALASR
jgi:excinuclease ABC subunit A